MATVFGRATSLGASAWKLKATQPGGGVRLQPKRFHAVAVHHTLEFLGARDVGATCCFVCKSWCLQGQNDLLWEVFVQRDFQTGYAQGLEAVSYTHLTLPTKA